jgi:hypothetical protein
MPIWYLIVLTVSLGAAASAVWLMISSGGYERGTIRTVAICAVIALGSDVAFFVVHSYPELFATISAISTCLVITAIPGMFASRHKSHGHDAFERMRAVVEERRRLKQSKHD